MDLTTFIGLYKDFLQECEKNGWIVEIEVKKFGYNLASITNPDGIKVQFFFEVDLENFEKLTETTNQSILKYGVIRKQGIADLFAKDVLEEFHQHLAKHSPKKNSKLIFYMP